MMSNSMWLRFILILGVVALVVTQIPAQLFTNLGYLALIKSRINEGLENTDLITYQVPRGGEATLLDQAAWFFAHALALRPYSASALAGQGRVNSDLGLTRESLRDWQSAVQYGYGGALGEFMLGNQYAQSGDRKSALGHWEQAVPAQANWQISLARKIFSQGRGGYDVERWGDAAQVLEDALKISSLADSERVEIYLTLADIYASMGKNELVFFNVEQALVIMPYNAKAHAQYARYLDLYTIERDRAETEAKRAIELGPDWWAFLVLGDIYLRNCEPTRAISMYQAGLKLGSGGDWRHIYLLEGLAQAQWENGNRQAAEEALTRLLELQPGFERIRSMLVQVEQDTLPHLCAR